MYLRGYDEDIHHAIGHNSFGTEGHPGIKLSDPQESIAVEDVVELYHVQVESFFAKTRVSKMWEKAAEPEYDRYGEIKPREGPK